MRWLILLTAAGSLLAADYAAPAGPRPATRGGAESVLPGGRLVAPAGRQYGTGPGPFGLAISPDGSLVVSANGGPDRYSLTVLVKEAEEWRARQLVAPRRRPDQRLEPGEDDWRSVFMGLAFHGNDELYAAEGNSGR